MFAEALIICVKQSDRSTARRTDVDPTDVFRAPQDPAKGSTECERVEYVEGSNVETRK